MKFIINNFINKYFINGPSSSKLFTKQEVFKIEPTTGKYYELTEHAEYCEKTKKYYSSSIYPLKYVGKYIERVKIKNELYEKFYTDQEIKIKYTNNIGYRELKLNNNYVENYYELLMFA